MPVRPRPLAVAAALLLSPVLAVGAEGASCHCFKDRVFDPARPAAADAFLLASARNSLLSAAFGVPKREIIQAVMTGTAPEDLWIAHWAARRSGRKPDSLLQARRKSGSWGMALFDLALHLPSAFNRALAREASDEELAVLVTDDVLVDRAGADPAAVAAARRAGASTQEIVLGALLSPRIGLVPASLREAVRDGRKTWGVLLTEAGVPPAELDRFVRQSVREPDEVNARGG